MTVVRLNGFVSSRITRLLIRVAEASGIPMCTLAEPTGLITPFQSLIHENLNIPWNDLVTLAERVSCFYKNDEDQLVQFGRSYYDHLEHLPYARLASTIITLRGALYLSHRFTTPHNYEALSCKSYWSSRTEGIKINQLKYADDKNSLAICLITKGILEYFPTLFGREPMQRVEMNINEREVIYFFTLPHSPGTFYLTKRFLQSLFNSEKKWQLLKEQNRDLGITQTDSHLRQKILDELLSQATQALVLIENGKPVFTNTMVSKLMGGEEYICHIPIEQIFTSFKKMRN